MRIRSISAIAAALVLIGAIGAPSATAQSTGVRAEVPFEFYAAGKLFPAGTYTLTQVNPGTLRLSDSRGRAIFVPADRALANPDEHNWIVFNQYGKKNFLAGAYWSGSSLSLRVPPSQGEREVAKTASQQSPIKLVAK